jgi:hypothetical protein
MPFSLPSMRLKEFRDAALSAPDDPIDFTNANHSGGVSAA